MVHEPNLPEGAFRIVLQLNERQPRLDTVLLQALRDQTDKPEYKTISRSAFKKLFTDQKIQIKGQVAKPSSALAAGTTYIDILP